MKTRPHWALLVALFAVVSLAVYGIARWVPFEPEAPALAEGPGGDAARVRASSPRPAPAATAREARGAARGPGSRAPG